MSGDGAALIFYKLRPDVVTPQNIQSNLLVSSMLDSPTSVLYHSLQKLYAPVLLKVLKLLQQWYLVFMKSHSHSKLNYHF